MSIKRFAVLCAVMFVVFVSNSAFALDFNDLQSAVNSAKRAIGSDELYGFSLQGEDDYLVSYEEVNFADRKLVAEINGMFIYEPADESYDFEAAMKSQFEVVPPPDYTQTSVAGRLHMLPRSGGIGSFDNIVIKWNAVRGQTPGYAWKRGAASTKSGFAPYYSKLSSMFVVEEQSKYSMGYADPEYLDTKQPGFGTSPYKKVIVIDYSEFLSWLESHPELLAELERRFDNEAWRYHGKSFMQVISDTMYVMASASRNNAVNSSGGLTPQAVTVAARTGGGNEQAVIYVVVGGGGAGGGGFAMIIIDVDMIDIDPMLLERGLMTNLSRQLS